MLTYSHITTLVSRKPPFSDNITDMVFVETATGPLLVSTGNWAIR